MNILVTGGAGYIGSHVCKALAEKGHVPIVYDSLSRGHEWAVQWGPLECGDIGDRARLRDVLARHRPAAAMHFAAFIDVGESCADPLLYYRNNVVGSQVLLREIAGYGPLPVVFSSTCAVYGAPQRLPLTEDHPREPLNPYGFSKRAVERMLAELDRDAGLRSVALRYFNAAGADPEGATGEAHEPETHLIPRVLAAARAGVPIDLYGTDYDTPDGTCVRDYVHVADIADAHVRALDYLMGGGASVALNLANARGHSVREVIAAAEVVTGRPIRTNERPRRAGDVPMLVGDARLARAVLGWHPARSDLAVQIEDAWRWIKSRNAPAGRR